MAMGMEKRDWLKIQKNWGYLRDELLVSPCFLDSLRSCPDNVLSHEDEQRISYEKVDADRIEKLLLILKYKPKCLNAYKWFVGTVKTHQEHVFTRLQQTVFDDSEVKVDPILDVRSHVRNILLEHFVNEDERSCSLPEVKSIVCILRGRQINYDWSDDKLQKFVVEVFSGIILEPGRKKKHHNFSELVKRLGALRRDKHEIVRKLRKLNTSTNTPSVTATPVRDISLDHSYSSNPRFVNLGLKNSSSVVPKVCTLSDIVSTGEDIPTEAHGEKLDVHCQKDIKSMTAGELKHYLLPMFSNLSLGEGFITKFRELEIDGEVFSTMKEEDFKSEFSSQELTFGKRRKLMLEKERLMAESKMDRKNLTQPSLKTTTSHSAGLEGTQTSPSSSSADNSYRDHFRRFDMPVAPTDKYHRGRFIEMSGFSRENMINPVRKFMSIDNTHNIYKNIAEETVVFASACMNDRTNGTLYVGIHRSSKETGQLGTVLGIVLDKEKCEDMIRLYIADKFYEDQHEIAFQAIRSTKFIEVVNSADPNAWIVEVDVVPLGKLVKDHAFFVRGTVPGHKQRRKQELYRLVDGSVQATSEKEIYEFMNKKKELLQMRLQQEVKTADSYIQPDLRKQILNLFTGGSETIEDEIYPILMTSPLDRHMDADYIRENLSFIQHFDAKAVFDFDPNSDTNGLYKFVTEKGEQIYEVQTTDNFDNSTGEYSEKLLESLKTSTERSWVFCNGYGGLRKEKMSAFEWKQNRSNGFKDSLRFFHSSIPLRRGIVLIFLFSSNYEVLLEAADEVILKFKDQWMAIAETEEIANLWKDELSRRNVVSKNSLNERFVIGMPWRHVNATFSQIISPRLSVACELSTSTGAFCVLKERVRIDMNDLDVLSRNECEAMEELQDRHSRELKRRRMEESFFRGAPVQWINFWFRCDHVLKRKQNKELEKLVAKALSTAHHDDDHKVTVVTLMHQPGAGGTTSSRQVLWDLREQHRCCLVKKVTDDTASQIVTLRNYDEKETRKPPLVLIDNEDEDKVHLLILELEEKAKLASRNEESFKVFCTVLLCMRRVNLPRSIELNKLLLKHELQEWELAWFQKKYETLERKFREGSKVDPKLLISFNILKTNFDPDYIKRTVAEYMKEVDDTKEYVLMRYLSLVNSYDIDYQTIPVSAFDPILGAQTKLKRIKQFGILQKDGPRSKGWETTMSTSVRVLVNESSQRGTHGSRIKTIRITSSLLAKEILAYIMRTSGQSVSDIMSEFMSSSLFDFENSSTHKLLIIIKNLVKRRVKQKDGRADRFSPLILDVNTKEGSELAAEICVDVYKKTEDPMIAQQIARFYIHTKNWLEAENYARIATTNLPKNSFLWDTFGQVYKQQLQEHYNLAKSGVKISNGDASKIMLLAQKAIDTFRKEQVLSGAEKTFIVNHGGYIGELRVIFLLLNILCHFESFSGGVELHRVLVDKKYTPESFSFLDREELAMLKSLSEAAFKAIRKLEDEQVQLKSESREELKERSYYDHKTLVILKENVNTYFGEESNEAPSSLREEDACEYRRRRVKRIGVTSLQGAMALMYEDNAAELLTTVYGLVKENVDTNNCTAFDLVTILNTVIALHVTRSPLAEEIPYEKIVEWSSQLYAAKQPEERPYLESFLYLVLFNLPTESRRRQCYRLCSEVRIQEALGRWREAFYKNYPRQRDTGQLGKRRDTTLFFLGRGTGLKELVYQKEIHSSGERMRDTEYWQSEKAKKRFQRLDGTLLVGGLEVQVQLQLPGGNKFHITIPTSLPTMKRSMWQKRVFFVLGFSWSGPKAYNITLDDPFNGVEDGGERCDIGSKPSFLRGLESITLKLSDIESATCRIEKELKTLEGKQNLSSKDKRKREKLMNRLEELKRASEELLGDGLD